MLSGFCSQIGRLLSGLLWHAFAGRNSGHLPGILPRCPDGYNLCVSTDFLERLATQLKANKSASCRRAIQRILAVVKKNFEDGKYKNDVEAEADFRQLVDRDEGCK